MTDREKLYELIAKARYGAAEMCHEKPSCKGCPHWDDRPQCRNIFIADHLIANGVVVREKGEWLHVCGKGRHAEYECSECKIHVCFDEKIGGDIPAYNLCPNCGAYMKKGENG